MAYITIRNFGEDSFEEKKSEFIGYAKRVENEEDDAHLLENFLFYSFLKFDFYL